MYVYIMPYNQDKLQQFVSFLLYSEKMLQFVSFLLYSEKLLQFVSSL